MVSSRPTPYKRALRIRIQKDVDEWLRLGNVPKEIPPGVTTLYMCPPLRRKLEDIEYLNE